MGNDRRLLFWAGLATALTIMLPGLGVAQTIGERLDAVEKKVDEQGKTIAAATGIDIHAMGMFDYNYNFNNPHGDTPLSTFNFKDSTFDVRQGSLFFERLRPDENWGFNLVMDFGSTAEAIAARWGGSNSKGTSTNLCGNSGSCEVEIREVWGTYKLPFALPNSDKISVKGGKFVTLLGYEIIPTYTAFNDNISTSYLFGFSIPFTHTGVLFDVPIGDMFALDLGVVNGWDNVKDNNSGKTLLGGFKIAPLENLSSYIAWTVGPENDPTSAGGPGAGSVRSVVTANVAYQATDMLGFALDSTWANDSNRLPSRSGTGTRSANWYGIAGYGTFNITPELRFALRAEWFDDPDGTQAGFDEAGPVTGPYPYEGAGATYWEITPTFSYALTEHITMRAEYRHDEASAKVFPTGSDNRVTGQDLVRTELIVAF
jgi:hypothetical protein